MSVTAAPTSPSTVDDYLGTLEGDAQGIATHLRDAIHAAAPGITDTIRYQMPCFLIDGKYLVHFGAWKNHIGLYPIPSDTTLEAEIGPYRSTKDTIRFRYKDPIPWDLVERLVAELVRRLTHRNESSN